MKLLKTYILLLLCIYFILDAQNKKTAPSLKDSTLFFGIKIIDPYRNLENIKDSAIIQWMREQNNYTQSILHSIPNRQYYIDKRIEFDKRKSASVYSINVTDNGKYFYLKKTANASTEKLFYKNSFMDKEELLFDPSDFKKNNNKEYQINYIKPNYDGTKVAIALTENGKEIAEMIIYDMIKKQVLPFVITNCWPSDGGGISWLSDNNSFIYLYYPVIDNTSDLFLKDTESVLYNIGDDPNHRNVIFSRKNNPTLKINSEDFPDVRMYQTSPKFLYGRITGASYFSDTYYREIKKKSVDWKFLFSKDEKVKAFIVVDDQIYFVSHKNINAIYKTSILKADFQNPELVVPNIKDEIINNIYITNGGFIFTTSKNGVEAKLYLYKKGNIISLSLPIPAGNISVTSKNNSNDFWITCSGWKNDEERFRYDAVNNHFIAENLAPIAEYPEFKDFVVEETTVKAKDGEEVPVSLIYNKNIQKDGNNPLLISAYGAYSISNCPIFSKNFMFWLLQGGMIAVAHVRGGGEKGEKWHMGGYKQTKPNSWNDLIACTEHLIKEKYTNPSKIAIWGASAGGITIGRALTERPDLFKVGIIEAGMLNTTRMYMMPNGANSAKEFGQIDNESDFKALLEMDAYQHIKKEKYPAVLVTTGINDPRVSPWMPAKFAAKLQADNLSENPILLQVDFKGGHGGNIPLAQKYSNLADIFAFALWQIGHPDYQPKK